MLKELNSENFEAETKSGLKLIEFYTDWCGYCKKQKSALEEMDKVWIGQVNADKAPAVALRYNINAYPTFLILKNGEEVERFSGLREKEDLMNRILGHMK